MKNHLHGGQRKNAGRKPKPEGEKHVAITLRAHPKTIKQFKTKAARAKISQSAYFAKITEEAK